MRQIGLALVAWIALTTVAYAIDITRCGQTVGRAEIGELMVDLDCPGFPGTCSADPAMPCMSNGDCPNTPTAVGCNTSGPFVEGGTLRLNGHTLASHDPELSQRRAVYVARKGTIQGPGTITAPDGTAVWFAGKRLTISNVEIRDSRTGINPAFAGNVRATNLTAHDLQGSALRSARFLRGKDITVTRCGLDPAEATYRSALYANRIVIDGLVANDNGGAAVFAESVRIDGGTLAGNAAGLGDWDLLTAKRPRLNDVTCHRSGLVSGESLGVPAPWIACTAD